MLVPIIMKKENVEECGNYRVIKLLSHTIKIWEKIMDERLRQGVEVSRGAERSKKNFTCYLKIRRRLMIGYQDGSCGDV